MSDFTVPDMIEPIVAFRAWNVHTHGLISINQHGLWPKRERFEASCPRSEPSVENVLGWEVVPFRQESFWLRDALSGEQLVDYSYSLRTGSGISYGLTGPTGATYHPQPYAMSAVTTVIAPSPAPVEIPTAPSALVLPVGWEFCIGYREVMHPPIHTSPPAEECACGIYALKDRDMGSHYVANAHAWGEVYLWGKVIEGEYGYRAQYAYPKTIETTDGSLEPLLSEYGVPVRNMSGVQVAVTKALAPSKTHTPLLLALIVNLFAIIWTTAFFIAGVLPWLNFAILLLNVLACVVLVVSLRRRL